MGAFLKEMPKNEGRAGAGRPKLGGAEVEPPKDDTATLAEIGITKKQSSTAQKPGADWPRRRGVRTSMR